MIFKKQDLRRANKKKKTIVAELRTSKRRDKDRTI